ncbi:uncharacterized protein NFIA_032740 [Aspergillus fischeri NRRL 181]|uniref:Uncharacterized protein n=1 Tax=Neosartorya fischeri (strain ATCC 1020 / DSM 3700 / CBS 544.65 / FGSC A1164 / JCM 1740 / NRRL 181 / WB 181) TaxID=331117 RepID=A1CY89_NEOFI|nr:uncharacterized protein NFIA_032740 [Aspergillus fischeri NRRL 181]EAW23709.1 hypothetical protein NFIA_032740 [Aspergillus fischeri NRRL 181]
METRVAMDEGRYAAEPTHLINGIRQLHSLVLEAEERCRRQKEENEEMRHKASKLIQQKDQHIVELTDRLNDLQYHPDILDDDEATQTMVNLSHELDVWVKGSFRNPDLLENLPRLELVHMVYSPLPLETIDNSRNTHQKWAFIRAFVTSYLFYYFFDPYIVGVRKPDTEYSLTTIESEVFDKCPGHVAGNWRSATSMAIQSFVKGYLEDAAMNCMREIEQLGSCASADPGVREKKLYELIQSCVRFKRRLERQPAQYRFSHASSGDKFISGTMQSVTGEEGEGAVVDFCLWPGLWKGDVLLYPETVWSRMDESSVEDYPRNRNSSHPSI